MAPLNESAVEQVTLTWFKSLARSSGSGHRACFGAGRGALPGMGCMMNRLIQKLRITNRIAAGLTSIERTRCYLKAATPSEKQVQAMVGQNHNGTRLV